MFAICIEASHSKGMGHFFRMLNFAQNLKEKNENFVFIINDHDKTKDILKSYDIAYEIVDLEYSTTNWEIEVIEKYKVLYWINDRLNTNDEHALNITNSNVKLITFDDLGSGAERSDLNICGLFFNKDNLKGAKVLKGIEYLILNNEIDTYKRKRKKIENILVTLGGSDTYGVTIKVLKILKKHKIEATIHIGPSFQHTEELKEELTDNYRVLNFIPSLIEEFNKFDLVVTGGGITPFEANASGLPCLIIANEVFEISNAKFLNKLKSSKFIGYHEEIDEAIFLDLQSLNISSMSQNGLNKINTKAVDIIYKEIKIL